MDTARRLNRGIVKRFLLSLVLLISLFIAFTSVWAASIFGSIANRLHSAGWSAASADEIMQPNESVTFEASYFIFKLGSVTFQFLGSCEFNGKPAYHIRASIDSYSGIPFVNFHGVYETYADTSTLTCLSTSNDQMDGKDWIHTSYVLNYAGKNLVWQQSREGQVMKTVDLPLDTTYTDGLSFFYFVRRACLNAGGAPRTLTVPIISDTNRSTVELTIDEAREPCEVTAYDFPIEAERLSGHINFKGTFGVTGDFTGWISDDPAEVPLRADLKVLIGSIGVKLKEIRREGWVPPRAE